MLWLRIVHAVALESFSTPLGTGVSSTIIEALDNNVRDQLQRTSHEFFEGVLISALLVALGVAFEGPEILHEMFPELFSWFTWTSKESLHKFERRIKRIGMVGWVLVVIGVMGEGIFEALQNRTEGQLQSFNNILLTDARLTSSTAKQSAIDAASAAGEAKAKAEAVSKEADQAEAKVTSVTKRAGEIEKQLDTVEYVLSARRVQDEDGLVNELRREYKGRDIALRSYSGDEEAFWLCDQLTRIAEKALLNAKFECGAEPLPRIPMADIQIKAPSIEEAQRLSHFLKKPMRVPGIFVDLGIAPELTVLIGVKKSYPLWPTKTTPK